MKDILVSLSGYQSTLRVGENLGIRYLKSFVEQYGFKIDILETQFENLSDIEIAEKLQSYDRIGFSINYSKQIERLVNIIELLDKKDKIIYLGGHVATILHRELLKNIRDIDFVILSDGEISLKKLFENNFDYSNIPNIAFLNKERNLIINEIEIINNLDIIPFPYRDENSFYLGDRHFSMITSRGCYNSCSYCSVGAYTKNYQFCKIRQRSARNIYEEIECLVKRYDIKYISFQDDLFLGPDTKSQNRALELSKLLINSGIEIFFSIMCSVKSIKLETIKRLYQAGLRNIFIGIENFCDNALMCFNKRIDENDIIKAIDIIKQFKGINIEYGFIMYYPEMSYKEILINAKKLLDLDLINLQSITNKLTIYIGSDYEEREIQEIEIYNDIYNINYEYRDRRINDFIIECKKFAKRYKTLEQKLYSLQFHSLINPSIDSSKVNRWLSMFRISIYKFVVNTYNKIFCDKPISIIDEMNIEKEVIDYYQNIFTPI